MMRDALDAGRVALGAWTFLSDPLIAEGASRAGYDYVCVDLQHGTAGFEHLDRMMASITLGAATPLVRVPWNESWMIGRALDAGAAGVIVPMVNSAADCARAVAACRYAPVGERSVGPIASVTRFGPRYIATANDTTMCIVMIETVEAVERIEEIVAVPGLDAVYVGPADLSLSLGLPAGVDQRDQRFADALARVVAACDRAGVIPGVHANPTLVPARQAAGFRFVTVGYDHAPLMAALRNDLAAARESLPGV